MEIKYPGLKIHRRTKYSKPSLEFLFDNSSNEFGIPDINNKPSLDNIIASFKNETHKIIENIQGNER